MIVLNQRDSKNWLYLKVNLFCPPAFRKVSLSCLQIPSVAANSCSGLALAQCIAVVAVSLNLPNSPVRHILLGFFCLFGFGGGVALCFDTPCSIQSLISPSPAVNVWCPIHWTSKEVRGTFYCYPHFLMRKPQKSSVTCPGSPSLSPDNSRDPPGSQTQNLPLSCYLFCWRWCLGGRVKTCLRIPPHGGASYSVTISTDILAHLFPNLFHTLICGL